MKRFLIPAISACFLLACGCGAAHYSIAGSETLSTSDDSRPLLGGYHAVAINDPAVVDAAQFALQTINQRSNSLVPYSLVKILSAKSQVVAGANYALTLQLSRGRVNEIHDVVVFSQPWTSTMRLIKDDIRG